MAGTIEAGVKQMVVTGECGACMREAGVRYKKHVWLDAVCAIAKMQYNCVMCNGCRSVGVRLLILCQ